jgi:predicted amidohydrolase YtcJ
MNVQVGWFIAFIVCILIFSYLFFWGVPESADVLFVNAHIYVMDAENTEASAFAVRGGRIVAVGSVDDLRRQVRAKEEVDLGGKTVLPGFIDSHAHLMSLGVSKLTVDLVGISSEKAIASLVEARVKRSERDQWIRGRGWDQNLWPSKKFPSHNVLDQVSPDNPVLLIRVDGHAGWANKRALGLAGITKETPDTVGGKIIRDAQGSPTGVFVDNAMALITRVLPPPTIKESEEAAKLAVQECLKHGLVSVHDMGVDWKDVELYKSLIDRKEFPFRVYAAVDGPGETWERFMGRIPSEFEKGPIIGYGDNRLWVRALKLYVDGALGSRGAALLETYSDDPGNRGLTVTDERSLRQSVDEALSHGFQVCTHAIGDRANNIILNVYESALKDHQKSDVRLRVEHAQILALDDIPRFKRLEILPCMQPTHCTSDMYWAEARVGPTRIRGAYAWRSLLETGVIVPGGSDFPVESPDPLLGIYAAVTRQDRLGRPKDAAEVQSYFQLSAEGIRDTASFRGGWYAAQKMTRLEAVRAFTNWAAYAGFQERILGSLEKGKLADFVILSKDILKIAPEEILTTTVEKTFIGGEAVYIRAEDTAGIE